MKTVDFVKQICDCDKNYGICRYVGPFSRFRMFYLHPWTQKENDHPSGVMRKILGGFPNIQSGDFLKGTDTLFLILLSASSCSPLTPPSPPATLFSCLEKIEFNGSLHTEGQNDFSGYYVFPDEWLIAEKMPDNSGDSKTCFIYIFLCGLFPADVCPKE